MNKRILLVSNVSWSAYFRRPLIEFLSSKGYEVHVAAGIDHYTKHLKSLPCTYHALPIYPKGTNLFQELRTLLALLFLVLRLKPMVFLGFSAKPVLYGSIVCRLLSIPVINNIPGLGEAFAKSNFLSRAVRFLYRISQKSVHTIFFQNEESKDLFLAQGIIKPTQAQRVPGSGVDLDRFSYQKLNKKKNITFLMIGRIIEEKGVYEYVQASKIVRSKYPDVRFQLLGPAGNSSLNEIDISEVESWVQNDIIDYLGETEDVMSFIIQADIIVLPTYYNEGVPRVLLEGAAVGRPLLATENVGCRDIVIPGTNGILVPSKDVPSLVNAMIEYIQMDYSQRIQFSLQGRKIVEEKYSHQIILKKYLNVIQSIQAIEK